MLNIVKTIISKHSTQLIIMRQCNNIIKNNTRNVRNIRNVKNNINNINNINNSNDSNNSNNIINKSITNPYSGKELNISQELLDQIKQNYFPQIK
jgi:hypothetical protein